MFSVYFLWMFERIKIGKCKRQKFSSGRLAYFPFFWGGSESNYLSKQSDFYPSTSIWEVFRTEAKVIYFQPTLTCLLSLSFFFFFGLFRATPTAYGSTQGRIRATAAGLHHSHSNAGSVAASVTYSRTHGNAGSLTHWARPGIEPTSSWVLVRFISAAPQ